jgi:hypothetical protein
VRFLGYHDTTSKQKVTKGYRLQPKAFCRPITGQILSYIIHRAETRIGDEAYVVILADTTSTIGCQNWLVEILNLKRMMSTSTISSPLQHDREAGIGRSDVDDLANTIYRDLRIQV